MFRAGEIFRIKLILGRITGKILNDDIALAKLQRSLDGISQPAEQGFAFIFILEF